MNRLVEETAADRGETEPIDGDVDPTARKFTQQLILSWVIGVEYTYMPTYTTSPEYQDSLEGKQIREAWVTENRVDPIAAKKLILKDKEEAENTFVNGHFLGSFAVSIITIEQILHEQLPENDGQQWSLGEIIDQAVKQDLLDDELEADLREIREKRRAKFHYRGKRDPAGMEGHIVERMREDKKSPDDIRGEDAKLALDCLYQVEQLAKIDIDPEKGPD